MTTIHSFPTELIRHTLSLAYPLGERGSGAGLCSTALVHSTWGGPSCSLMTEVLTFDSTLHRSLSEFLESGPVGFACRVLSLSSCREADVRAILAKAGSIKHLKYQTHRDEVASDLFRFASLRKLESFDLSGPSTSWNDGQGDQTKAISKYKLWAPKLSSIVLSTPFLPINLINSSQDKLAKFELYWPLGGLPDALDQLSQSFPQLTTFKVAHASMPGSFQLSRQIVALAGLFPRLAHLTLTKLWPQQLEQLLASLSPHSELASLQVALWEPSVAIERIDRFAMGALGKAEADWEPALQRCVRLPALSALVRWHLSVLKARVTSHSWQPIFEEGLDEEGSWPAFEAEVEAAGIELILGPLDH